MKRTTPKQTTRVRTAELWQAPEVTIRQVRSCPLRGLDASAALRGSVAQRAKSPQCETAPARLPAGTLREGERWLPVRGADRDFLGDVLLPSQFFTPPAHSARYANGVRRLLLAVLQNALVCWFRSHQVQSASGRRLFRETQGWFWATERNYLCAFERICEYLELDPDSIRRGLLSRQGSGLS